MSERFDLDEDLKALFEAAREQFTPEPFVSILIAEIARRSRVSRLGRIALVLALIIAAAALTPLAVSGSMRLGDLAVEWLPGASDALGSPWGVMLAVPIMLWVARRTGLLSR